MTTFATTFARIDATGSPLGQKLSRARRIGLLPALRNGLLLAAAIFMLAPAGLRAATDDDTPDTGQPRADARAVRLSSVEGQVRVVQDGQVIADPAYNNLPLFEGTQITTGDDGRAEIQLEDGSLVRLSPNSGLTFPVMKLQGTSTHTEVELNGGLAYFELQPSNLRAQLAGELWACDFLSDRAGFQWCAWGWISRRGIWRCFRAMCIWIAGMRCSWIFTAARA